MKTVRLPGSYMSFIYQPRLSGPGVLLGHMKCVFKASNQNFPVKSKMSTLTKKG